MTAFKLQQQLNRKWKTALVSFKYIFLEVTDTRRREREHKTPMRRWLFLAKERNRIAIRKKMKKIYFIYWTFHSTFATSIGAKTSKILATFHFCRLQFLSLYCRNSTFIIAWSSVCFLLKREKRFISSWKIAHKSLGFDCNIESEEIENFSRSTMSRVIYKQSPLFILALF